jgi:hypothetical protein
VWLQQEVSLGKKGDCISQHKQLGAILSPQHKGISFFFFVWQGHMNMHWASFNYARSAARSDYFFTKKKKEGKTEAEVLLLATACTYPSVDLFGAAAGWYHTDINQISCTPSCPLLLPNSARLCSALSNISSCVFNVMHPDTNWHQK